MRLNHYHGWIQFKPGDEKTLSKYKSEKSRNLQLGWGQIPKSEYGRKLIPKIKTWPHVIYENGIFGEFIYIHKGRSQFKKWIFINKIYHLHLESPSGKWEVLQLETIDGEVLSIDVVGRNNIRLWKNVLKSVFKENFDTVYFEIPTSLSHYNNPVHGRHDAIGNKKHLYQNGELDSYSYTIDKNRIVLYIEGRIKLLLLATGIFLVPLSLYFVFNNLNIITILYLT